MLSELQKNKLLLFLSVFRIVFSIRPLHSNQAARKKSEANFAFFSRLSLLCFAKIGGGSEEI